MCKENISANNIPWNIIDNARGRMRISALTASNCDFSPEMNPNHRL